MPVIQKIKSQYEIFLVSVTTMGMFLGSAWRAWGIREFQEPYPQLTIWKKIPDSLFAGMIGAMMGAVCTCLPAMFSFFTHKNLKIKTPLTDVVLRFFIFSIVLSIGISMFCTLIAAIQPVPTSNLIVRMLTMSAIVFLFYGVLSLVFYIINKKMD